MVLAHARILEAKAIGTLEAKAEPFLPELEGIYTCTSRRINSDPSPARKHGGDDDGDRGRDRDRENEITTGTKPTEVLSVDMLTVRFCQCR